MPKETGGREKPSPNKESQKNEPVLGLHSFRPEWQPDGHRTISAGDSPNSVPYITVTEQVNLIPGKRNWADTNWAENVAEADVDDGSGEKKIKGGLAPNTFDVLGGIRRESVDVYPDGKKEVVGAVEIAFVKDPPNGQRYTYVNGWTGPEAVVYRQKRVCDGETTIVRDRAEEIKIRDKGLPE